MSWFVLAILSSIFIAVSRIFQGLALKTRGSDEKVFAFAFQFLVGIILLILAIINGLNYSGYENYIPNILLMIVLYSIAGLGIAYAFKRGKVSDVLILTSSTTIWAFIFSLIILNEEITIFKLISLFLIFISLVLINLDGKRLKIDKVGLVTLFSSLLIGLAFVNDTYVLGDRDLLSYISLTFIFPSLMILIAFPKTIIKLKAFRSSNLLLLLLLTSITFGLGMISQFSSYQMGGDASSISPITSSSTILAVILAIIFFKERDNLKLKSIAIMLTAIGLILFSLV